MLDTIRRIADGGTINNIPVSTFHIGGPRVIDMDRAIEEQVGDAINEVFRRLDDWSYEQLAEGFRAIRDRFTWLSHSDPLAFREVERRVAEDTLLVAEDTEQPVADCERLLERVLELGWTDRYRAPEVLLPFCRYCIDYGRPDRVHHYLAPVAAELREIPPASGQEELHASLVTAVQEMLRVADSG